MSESMNGVHHGDAEEEHEIAPGLQGQGQGQDDSDMEQGQGGDDDDDDEEDVSDSTGSEMEFGPAKLPETAQKKPAAPDNGRLGEEIDYVIFLIRK